jgi:hypothetical protein
MRAWDISLFILIINLTIGFVGNIGLFNEYGYAQIQSTGNASQGGYASGNYDENTQTLMGNQQKTTADTFDAFAMILSGFFMMISVFVSCAIMFLPLVYTFHVPVVLALFLQAIVYYAYLWGITQWVSNKQGGYLE